MKPRKTTKSPVPRAGRKRTSPETREASQEAPRLSVLAGTPGFDAARGRSSFEKLLPRLRKLAANELAPTTADIKAAVTTALAVAARVTAPAVYQRFRRLPSEEFDIENVDDLATAAWAVWHALAEVERLRAHVGEAKLPAALVSRAAIIEGRMQQCCEYYFGDDPEVAVELARLRPGTSYRDLAGDLLGYVEIYRSRHDVVSRDRKYYRAGDLEEASEVAERMLSLLGEGLPPEGRAARDHLARAWTLLLAIYGEVAEAGMWLERKNPERRKRYPALFAAGRTNVGGRPRKQSKDAPGTAPK